MNANEERLLGNRKVARYELRFEHMFHSGKALSFPCDATGQVPLDELSDRGRTNYLYARAVVGREFFFPAVTPSPTTAMH